MFRVYHTQQEVISMYPRRKYRKNKVLILNLFLIDHN